MGEGRRVETRGGIIRVSTNTIEEFMESLVNEKAIYQDTIRVSISKSPIDGKKYDASKFEIILQASTVVCCQDGSEFMLDCGVVCGIDYTDETAEEKEKNGSAVASDFKAKIQAFVSDRGWKVLPGIISD